MTRHKLRSRRCFSFFTPKGTRIFFHLVTLPSLVNFVCIHRVISKKVQTMLRKKSYCIQMSPFRCITRDKKWLICTRDDPNERIRRNALHMSPSQIKEPRSFVVKRAVSCIFYIHVHHVDVRLASSTIMMIDEPVTADTWRTFAEKIDRSGIGLLCGSRTTEKMTDAQRKW